MSCKVGFVHTRSHLSSLWTKRYARLCVNKLELYDAGMLEREGRLVLLSTIVVHEVSVTSKAYGVENVFRIQDASGHALMIACGDVNEFSDWGMQFFKGLGTAQSQNRMSEEPSHALNKWQMSSGEMLALQIALQMSMIQHPPSSGLHPRTRAKTPQARSNTLPHVRLRITVPEKKRIRMQRHTPVIPFADFVVSNLIGQDHKYAPVLREIARMFLYDPAAANPSGAKVADERLSLKVDSLWLHLREDLGAVPFQQLCMSMGNKFRYPDSSDSAPAQNSVAQGIDQRKLDRRRSYSQMGVSPPRAVEGPRSTRNLPSNIQKPTLRPRVRSFSGSSGSEPTVPDGAAGPQTPGASHSGEKTVMPSSDSATPTSLHQNSKLKKNWIPKLTVSWISTKLGVHTPSGVEHSNPENADTEADSGARTSEDATSLQHPYSTHNSSGHTPILSSKHRSMAYGDDLEANNNAVTVRGWADNSPKGLFLRELLYLLTHLCNVYFMYNWDDAGAVLRANEKSAESDTEEAATVSRGRMLWARLKRLYFRKRATELLRAQRDFQTLGRLLKIAQGPGGGDREVAGRGDRRELIAGDRRPIILFLGGGMGAGKSSLLAEVMTWRFWRECGANAVVIEADRIKTQDPVFRALTMIEKGDASVSVFVHNFSTSEANKLLVTALAHSRDIIMDGTLMWEEYVVQTLAMVRNAHKQIYMPGPGYSMDEAGNISEVYWKSVSDRPPEVSVRRPYRIQILGVTCAAHLAVARGMRRKLLTGRGVPVPPQLKSHRLFATNFESYVELVDEAQLFDTTEMGPPKLIAHKSLGRSLLVDPERYRYFKRSMHINDQAKSVSELYLGSVTHMPSASASHDSQGANKHLEHAYSVSGQSRMPESLLIDVLLSLARNKY